MPLSSEEDSSKKDNSESGSIVVDVVMDAETSVSAAQQVVEIVPAMDAEDGVVADPPPDHAVKTERCPGNGSLLEEGTLGLEQLFAI